MRRRSQSHVDDPTDEDYAAAARTALHQRDLELAIQQLSAALALRPLHRPHLQLLDQIIDRARAPLVLLKLPAENAFYGLCAARAWALARRGRHDEAVEALFAAAAFSPSTPFLEWARDWVNEPKRAKRIRAETLAAGIVRYTRAARATSDADDGISANLEAALYVASRVVSCDALLVAESHALRLLGRCSDALRRLQNGTEGWEIAVEQAAVHHRLGDSDAQCEALERARRARPDEPATLLDLAACHVDAGRLEPALNTYERALALAPAAPWTLEMRARTEQLEKDVASYRTRLGDPIDPLVSVIRSVATRGHLAPAQGRVHVRVRTELPLAPSARVAFEHTLARANREGSVDVQHDGPWLSFGPLWTPSGAPALPPPDRGVVERVAALANTAFSWRSWMAGRLADIHAQYLVQAMAHPPAPPDDRDCVQWVHGFQVAAALCLTTTPDALHQLVELTRGEGDWSAAAAMIGLRALAEARPELSGRVRRVAEECLPRADAPLPPAARALAQLGCALADGASCAPFLRLRARVHAQLWSAAESGRTP